MAAEISGRDAWRCAVLPTLLPGGAAVVAKRDIRLVVAQGHCGDVHGPARGAVLYSQVTALGQQLVRGQCQESCAQLL